MLFQTLDDKKECVGIYYAGELSFNDGITRRLRKYLVILRFLERSGYSVCETLLWGADVGYHLPRAFERPVGSRIK